MYSVSGNHWEEITINKRIVDKVKLDHRFSEIISKLIVFRKFNQFEIDTIKKDIFLNNPFLNNDDFEQAYKILEETIKKKEKILIIGDYDVDGCVSTSLLVNFFKKINVHTDYYIPNRFKDGYGASLNLVKKLIKKKPDLIIMLDCGSNSVASVNYLRLKKIKTIIIDHHVINHPYPKANSIINPKKKCKYTNFDYLCTAFIVYFLIDFYIKKKKLDVNFVHNLAYVLLATVCDVMPLRNLNRLLAINIFKNPSIYENFIFKKILVLKDIKRPLQINDLGFLIGPIFNSAGRLGDANIIVELLTTENRVQKENIINKLLETNEKRKIIENNLLKKINFYNLKNLNQNVIVLYENFFNEGIIGIVAARIKEFFNKPSVVITKSNNNFKASARSTSNFNIGYFIKECVDKKILIDGGGHNLAAGFTIKKDNISKFRDYINLIYDKQKLNNSRKYISKISFNSINFRFYENLKVLAPFGSKNNEPFFLIENIKIIKPKIIKNKYVSFYAKSKYGKSLQAISFNHLDSDINKSILFNKNKISLIVQIKENLWNNKKSLQLIVSDVIDFSNKA